MSDSEPETQKASLPASPSLMSRRLQTFGSPDLAVAIGKNERIYRYHSLILASQSLYVDTLLSSPAAKREQDRGLISFPEIDVGTWEKMMKYLKPTAMSSYPTLDDLLEIVPPYDQFQFHGGLEFCDSIISDMVPTGSYANRSYIQKFTRLVSFIHPLNSFPISKPKIVQWASKCLSNFYCIDEEMIKLLIPLVENDDDVIKSMVSTYLGRMCKGMTMNEMRDLINQPDFPEECILRCHQIQEIDEQREHLHVKSLCVNCNDKHIDGTYEYLESAKFQEKSYTNEFAVSHAGGATVGIWRRKHYYEEVDEVVILEAADVFGSVWEIYTRSIRSDSVNEAKNEEEEGDQENRRVLFRWGGMFDSLIPPKRGWKAIDDNGNEVPTKEIYLSYFIDRN